MKPVGGWEKTTTSAITGKGRTMLPFRDNAGNKYIAVGTSSKLYIYTGQTSTPSDITPTSPAFTAGNEVSAVGTGFGSGPYNGTAVYKTYTASTISAERANLESNASNACSWSIILRFTSRIILLKRFIFI